MKKLLILILVGCMLLGSAGCGKVAMDAVVAHAEELDVSAPIDTETQEPLPTDTPINDDTVVSEETEEVVEEERILVAKSYQQVYPELYNYYPEEPERTYSKWVYSIDRSSGFIGTIYFKDGTSITSDVVGKDDSYDYNRDDNTAGKTDTGNKPGGVEGGDVSDKVIGDMSTNPAGKDIDMISTGGDYTVKVSTKPIKNAIVDESSTTPYRTVFSVGMSRYYIKTNTIDGSMAMLLEEGIYKNLDGSIYVDQQGVVKTNKGTFTPYTYVGRDGTNSIYAISYTPKYASNTMYVMYAEDMKDNANIVEMFQMMVLEGGE